MAPERTQFRRRGSDFDPWKLALRRDCERLDKVRAFDSLTDPILKLLWESGLDPTVQAIIECAALDGKKPN